MRRPIRIQWQVFAICLGGLLSAYCHAELSLPRLPEVACRYQLQWQTTPDENPQFRDWFFWRTADNVQTRDADGEQGEIWQLTATKNIVYRKLYYADKVAVEYMPADLLVNNQAFAWEKLTSMLSEDELEALKPVKSLKVLGRAAEQREGTINGQALQVIWMVNEKLPAQIIRTSQSGRQVLKLIAINSLENVDFKPISDRELADYRHIDAADLGDMEHDPVVQKILRKEGHQHHH